MSTSRLNVSTTSPYPPVAHRRKLFDQHVDTCHNCQPSLCDVAQSLWRGLCMSALRAVQGN